MTQKCKNLHILQGRFTSMEFVVMTSDKYRWFKCLLYLPHSLKSSRVHAGKENLMAEACTPQRGDHSSRVKYNDIEKTHVLKTDW